MHKRLLEVLDRALPPGTLEVHHSMDDLYQRLAQPRDETAITILRAAEPADLHEFFKLRDLLSDIMFIVILPDRNPRTISLAHAMRPRYLSFADSDLRNLGAVLGKMQARIHERRFPA